MKWLVDAVGPTGAAVCIVCGGWALFFAGWALSDVIKARRGKP